MFSLESPNANIPFLIYKKKIALNYRKSAAMELLSKGLKNESETTVPLKSYRKTLANIFAISAVLLISSQAIRILSVVYLSEDVKMHPLVLPKILMPP